MVKQAWGRMLSNSNQQHHGRYNGGAPVAKNRWCQSDTRNLQLYSSVSFLFQDTLLWVATPYDIFVSKSKDCDHEYGRDHAVRVSCNLIVTMM